MYEVTQILYNSLDKNKKQIAVFLDLAKAFDTVCHKKLIEKLETYGIQGIENELFCSYLESREQCVKIGQFIGNN